MKYYYADSDNKPVGPLSREALMSLKSGGIITGSTAVNQVGSHVWRRFGDAFEMPSALPPPIPPQLPPRVTQGFELVPLQATQGASRERESRSSEFGTRGGQSIPSYVLEDLLHMPLMQNASDASESQIVIGVMHLQNNEPAKAHILFQSALQITHKVPAAWLGKAYAEAALTSVEKNTLELIQYSLEKTSQYIDDRPLLAKHYALVLSVALGRSAIQIQEYVASSSAMSSQAVNAASSALRATAVGVASAYMGYRSKSTLGKALGYGGAAAAGVHASNQFMNSAECSRLANSAYALAIAQAYISLAYVYEIRNVFSSLSPEIQAAAGAITDTVKSRWLLLYQSQLRQLGVFVGTIERSLRSPDGVDKIMALRGNYQEVTDVVFMAQKFGLERHPTFSKLMSFTGDLQKAMGSSESQLDMNLLNGRGDPGTWLRLVYLERAG